MTHQYMEIKIKELEKRIDALEKEHCEYKPFTIGELDEDMQKLFRSFQDQKVLDSVIPDQEPCENCISRQAVINTIHKTIYGFFDVVDDDSEEPINDKDKLLLSINKGISNAVKALPLAIPQPKMGRWMLKRIFPTKLYDEHLNEYECSECSRGIRCTESQLVNYPYCHCGAKMQEVKE